MGSGTASPVSWWSLNWPLVHAWLMTVSMFVVIPIAIAVAHYRLSFHSIRHALFGGAHPHAPAPIVRPDEWLDTHLTVMLFGVFLAVLGWVIAFLSTETNFRSLHSFFGSVILFAVVFVQPHFAYDETPVKHRHITIGYALAACAIAAIALGWWTYAERYQTVFFSPAADASIKPE